MSDSGSAENAPPAPGDAAAAQAHERVPVPPRAGADGAGAGESPTPPVAEGGDGARQAAPPAEAGAAEAGSGAAGGGSTPDEPSAEPYRVSVRDLGRFAVAAVTVVAALAGLILGIRSELYAGREDQRAKKAEQRAVDEQQRANEAREKAYADLVDFYRMGSQVIVVNGSSRVMAMRLTLPGSHVRWDLDLLQPCKQISIANRSMLDSMAAEEPSVKLVEEDLAQLRLEFMDPLNRAWIRNSGGAVARTAGWQPSGRPFMVSSESWNSTAQDAPACGKT
ncbi:hypothetical protein [Streptomyces sp. NPDC005533]|uniref:hypothetical protein n=1 Tax=Streptomyces sp. NPDC005533 TaxID=3364723 RepID=UPI003696A69D